MAKNCRNGIFSQSVVILFSNPQFLQNQTQAGNEKAWSQEYADAITDALVKFKQLQ